MAEVWKRGTITLSNTRATFSKAKKQERVTSSLMVIITKVTLKTDNFTETENITLTTLGRFMKVILRTIISLAMV